jgi:hypothetical protein
VKVEASAGKFATIVIGLCVATVVGTASLLLVPGARNWLAGQQRYSIGDRVDLPDTLSDRGLISLLVFSRHDCGACQEARPALADLVRAVRADPSVRIRLVTGATHADENLEFAEMIGVRPDERLPVDWDLVRVDRVPLVLVVDRGGVVQYVHQGAPTLADVEAAIKKSSF